MNPDAFNVNSAWRVCGMLYKEQLKELKDIRVIVEIGTDWGYSFFTLARDFPDAAVYSIDDWRYHDAERAKVHVRHMLHDFKNARLLELESSVAYRWWRQPENYLDIDLLHIDGDHSGEGVKKDYESWGSIVRPGGAIMFHDIYSCPEVGAVFKQLEGRKVEIDQNGPGLGILFKDA